MIKVLEDAERIAKETGKDIVEIYDHMIAVLEGKRAEAKAKPVAPVPAEPVVEPVESVEPVAQVPAEPVVEPVATSGEPVADAVGESASGNPVDAVAPTTETPTV